MPFSDALKQIGVEQTGQAHTAIDDARNLAKMVMRLNAMGADFTRATTWYQDL